MPERKSVSRKPDCYGDSDEYNPMSGVCKKCPYRYDCRDQIDKDVNKTAGWPQTTRKKKKKTSGEIEPITTGKAIMSLGDSPYNHTQPLAPQFFTFLGFSLAKATLIEGVQLIDSARDNYATQNMRDIESIIKLNNQGESDDDS